MKSAAHKSKKKPARRAPPKKPARNAVRAAKAVTRSPRKVAAKPAAKVAPKKAAPKRKAAPSGEPRAPMVLVVDDYEDAREMYCEYLQFSGFRTAEAKTGVEALQQAASLLPDIILMDLSLPEMDGWEATRRLKASADTKHIPVVALTGHALAGHSESAREAGCDSFVAKPCLPEDLVVEVKRLLGDNQGTGRKPTPQLAGRS